MIKVNYLPTDNDENIVFESQNIIEPTTDRSLKNIKKTLIYSLRNTYGIKDKEKINDIADSLLRIHGLHKDNFDFVKEVGVAIKENINEFSIDDNSNKGEKNPRSILTEVVTPVSKLIGYDYLYQIMRELYSKEEAKRLSGLMYDYTLALADSASILLPYCFAIDASRIITEGKPFGQLESSSAHRIDSYISVLNEVLHTMSNNLAGAIAVSTFFMDVAHLGIYRENISLKTLKKNKTIRKYISNQFQKIVHGVNSLSRNGGVESPFTNISILDRTKLNTVLNEDNGYLDMLFISTKSSKVFRKSGVKVKDRTKWKNYVIEYIIELQKIFMSFFDNGDPTKGNMPFRFPVATINMGKSLINNTWIIEDDKFLEDICHRKLMRYNIFVSEGTRFASCCRLLSDMDLMDLAAQSNSFGGGGSTSIGSHRVITINFARLAYQAKSLEDFYEVFKNRVEDTAKILKAHRQLIIWLNQKKLQPFITLGWIRLDRMFSTFGMIGIVEAELILRTKFNIDLSFDLIDDILRKFNLYAKEYAQKYEFIFNIEQIPGESMMLRLPKADKLINEDAFFDIYANQFIPLWDNKSTIFERIEKDGKYNQLVTGGGIVHLNVGEEPMPKQYKGLIQRSVEAGCEHFSVTGTYCLCSNNHNSLGNFDICPLCGAEIIEKRARTVGFWTRLADWKNTKVVLDHDKRKIYSTQDMDA